MDRNRLRFILALIITGGYVVLVGILVGAVIAKAIPQTEGVEIIEEISKVMAGFIGLIIGYYFSRGQSNDDSDGSGQAVSNSGSSGQSNSA